MSQNLSSYQFSPKQLQLLKSNGFVNVRDVIELTPSELSKELSITSSDALEIIELIKTDNTKKSNDRSAYELLQEEESDLPIVTFCAALDEAIGGGIPIGKITEFCGAPGIGKTQFGMQLAVDAHVPEVFGGVEGEAIYIDCEGSFICERVIEIAQATVDHIENTADDDSEQDAIDALKKFSVESILKGIHVYRCHDYVQLVALSYLLPQFLQQHPKTKIIILDSIAFHFRHDFEDMGLRTRLLHGLVQSFMKMANDHKLAVVFMNQMTTKFSSTEDSKLVPALGQSWGHACTIRIILNSKNGQRYAHLFKSPNRQEATVPFDVTRDGIRDINIGSETIDQSSTLENNERKSTAHGELGSSKRQRLGS